MAKKKEYASIAKTTTIAATSRASVKVQTPNGDAFYTVEYHEERCIPDLPEVDLVKERELLWDTCNTEVDNQIEEIELVYAKSKNKK